DAARERAMAALRSATAAARDLLGDEAMVAVGDLAGAISAVEPGGPRPPGDLEPPLAALRDGFEAAREAAAGRAAVAADQATRLHAAAAEAARQADEVLKRREVPPDLPGYAALLAALESEAPLAAPLYRLFE